MSNENITINQITNAVKIGMPLSRPEREMLIQYLNTYQNLLNIIEPLHDYNTHNEVLNKIKNITKDVCHTTKSSECISTPLPVGTLKVYDDHNRCYPGIHVMFTPKHTDVEIDVCAVQMHQDMDDKDDTHLHVYVFDNPTSDDCTIRTKIDTTQYQIE